MSDASIYVSDAKDIAAVKIRVIGCLKQFARKHFCKNKKHAEEKKIAHQFVTEKKGETQFSEEYQVSIYI